MKKLLALLLALMLLSLAACGADDAKPTDKDHQTNGPTQNQTPSQNQTGEDEPTVSRILSQTITYPNSDGSLQTRYVYDDNGILLQKMEITNGNEAEARVYTVECDAHGNPLKEISDEMVNTYTYNEQGQLVQMDILGGTITYNYDENGRSVASTITNEAGVIEQRDVWENDVRVGIAYYVNGIQEQIIRFTYDEQGRIQRQDVYSVNELLLSYTVYTYTDTKNGYKLEMAVYYADGTGVQTIVEEFANYPAL